MRQLTLVLFWLALASLCGCDGATCVNGSVMDLDGTPIGGATIRVEATPAFQEIVRKPHEATTREDGGFDPSFAHRPVHIEFVMTVNREGYAEVKEFISNGAHNNREVRLKPVKN